MKAFINTTGALVIRAESQTESYGLRTWYEYNKEIPVCEVILALWEEPLDKDDLV